MLQLRRNVMACVLALCMYMSQVTDGMVLVRHESAMHAYSMRQACIAWDLSAQVLDFPSKSVPHLQQTDM